MASCRIRDALRQARALALAGDWQAAHRLVQLHQDEPAAAHVHAILHRIEGDLGNAAYWYRRAGVAMPALAPEDELRGLDLDAC